MGKTVTKDFMVRRFRYLSNTTPTAIKKGYPKKEIQCNLCGGVLTEDDFDDMEYIQTHDKDEHFYHRKCIKNW